MARKTNRGFWEKIRISLQNLRDEMYKNSVANAGPSDAACCHKPVEELERERERYRRIAAERRIRHDS